MAQRGVKNFYGLRRIIFSGDNRITHLIGKDVQFMNPESPSIDASIVHWSFARWFGVTTSGRLANVPISASPGDIVCTFLGGSVPCVLRPRADGCYTLVGECYVQGITNDEAGTPGKSSKVKGKYTTSSFAIK
jgi:hypothetical protein